MITSKKITEYIWIKDYNMLEEIKVGVVDRLVNEFNEEFLLVYNRGHFSVVSEEYKLTNQQVEKAIKLKEIRAKIKELSDIERELIK